MSNLMIRVTGASDRGTRHRRNNKPNEDFFLFGAVEEKEKSPVQDSMLKGDAAFDKPFLAAVADGMGGTEQGREAAETTLRLLSEFLLPYVSEKTENYVNTLFDSLDESVAVLQKLDFSDLEAEEQKSIQPLVKKFFKTVRELYEKIGENGRLVKKNSKTEYTVEYVDDYSEQLFEINKKLNEMHLKGATLSGAVLTPGEGKATVTVFNVGDSPIYLIHNGKIVMLSYIHNVAWNKIRVNAKLNYYADGSLEFSDNLTRCMGETIEPDALTPSEFAYVREFEMYPDDVLVIGSDGLDQLRMTENQYDYRVYTQRLQELITGGFDSAEVILKTAQRDYERFCSAVKCASGGSDDTTVMVIRLEETSMEISGDNWKYSPLIKGELPEEPMAVDTTEESPKETEDTKKRGLKEKFLEIIGLKKKKEE